MGKYTLTGSQEFDQLIDQQLVLVKDEILKIIPSQDIAAILLGGGYGRGEGGVLFENDTEYLYNDYDLFVILRNVSYRKKKEYQSKIHLIHEKFTPMFKIDVDVGPLQTVSAIAKAPHWMMWYELKNGHMVLWGKENIKNYFPDYSRSKMPIMEAYRLLLNRGVGLLLCQKHFDTFEEEESKEFILRNIRKAQLAMGDAFLIKKGLFHYSYKRRDDIFTELVDEADLKLLGIYQDYKTAYNFKERPHKANLSKAEYLEEYKRVLVTYEKVYNWVFTGQYSDHLLLAEYQNVIYQAFNNTNNLKELAKNICKNVKIGYSLKNRYLLTKHPRFRLFMTLPYFLFKIEEISCQEILTCNNCQNKEDLLNVFIDLWEKNN